MSRTDPDRSWVELDENERQEWRAKAKRGLRITADSDRAGKILYFTVALATRTPHSCQAWLETLIFWEPSGLLDELTPDDVLDQVLKLNQLAQLCSPAEAFTVLMLEREKRCSGLTQVNKTCKL